MKTLKLIIALLAGFVLATFDCFPQYNNIPNGDFEAWKTDIELEQWNSTNDFGFLLGITPVIKSNDSESGSNSVVLKTFPTQQFINLPGLVTYGKIGIGTVTGGIPFTSRPTGITGYFKHPTVGDFPYIVVLFYKQNGAVMDTIGRCFIVISDTSSNYQQFNEKIAYTSDSNPDLMNIIISSDMQVPGSTLYIDNLKFTYETSLNIETPVHVQDVRIFPNPAKVSLTIENTAESHIGEIAIYNEEGRLVHHEYAREPRKILNTTCFENGVYFIFFKNDNQLTERKLIIAK